MGELKEEDVKYIVVHCSDSPNAPDDQRYDTVRDIHRWHLEKGYSGIGYHYVIQEDGKFKNGRPLFWVGAHCLRYNSCSVGICLIGEDEFSPDQMNSLELVILACLQQFPSAEVVGHRDLDPNKECPGFDVKSWWGNRFS